MRVQWPQIGGREEPFGSAFWGQRAPTSDVLKRLIVEREVGGRSQRDLEESLESARGHFGRGKSPVSELRVPLRDEDEAWRTRDLSHESGT